MEGFTHAASVTSHSIAVKQHEWNIVVAFVSHSFGAILRLFWLNHFNAVSSIFYGRLNMILRVECTYGLCNLHVHVNMYINGTIFGLKGEMGWQTHVDCLAARLSSFFSYFSSLQLLWTNFKKTWQSSIVCHRPILGYWFKKCNHKKYQHWPLTCRQIFNLSSATAALI